MELQPPHAGAAEVHVRQDAGQRLERDAVPRRDGVQVVFLVAHIVRGLRRVGEGDLLPVGQDLDRAGLQRLGQGGAAG